MDWASHYGSLYFDQYVLHKWDYTFPSSQDQFQWHQIARKWLSLTLEQRELWYEFMPDRQIQRPTPSQAQIDHALMPHQTLQERRFAIEPNQDRAIWLRTCYELELADTYYDMSRGVADHIVDASCMFDDETLYAYDKKWDRILTRLPTLCDGWYDSDTLEYFLSDDPPAPEHHMHTLWDAANRAVVMVYLLDKQALLEKLVTVMWLDCHGECVWWWRVESGDPLQCMCGWLSEGGLHVSLQYTDPRDDFAKRVCQKGTLVDWC